MGGGFRRAAAVFIRLCQRRRGEASTMQYPRCRDFEPRAELCVHSISLPTQCAGSIRRHLLAKGDKLET